MSPNNEQTQDKDSSKLICALRSTLNHLAENPYPYVAGPKGCSKRASVALVLRVRPHYQHWPSESSQPTSIDQYFQQDWAQHGDPEVLFIKRAARVGDRWTSHVALPGGKRDPEDEDDKAVGIRETSEEIGLDLTSPDALFVGNLPERVVSTSWGKVPIMVLCPFVFLWTQPDMPPLKLQPTEVASTHWVPLRVLLSPSARTFEYVDVSDRFAGSGWLRRTLMWSILGQMRFSAIRLIPSESLYCSSTAEFFPPEPLQENLPCGRRLYNWCRGDHTLPAESTRPLLLWGLTLGMLADFLDQLPPHNAVKLWVYPTFTSFDARWIINILTRSLKRRNAARLQSGNQTAIDGETEAVATGDIQEGPKNTKRPYAVGVMLEGYYDMLRRGVWIAASVRSIALTAIIIQAVRKYREYRS